MLAALALSAAALCPQRLDVDLQRWKEALQKAEAGSQQQQLLLEQLGFRKVPSGSDLVPDAECAEHPEVQAVDLLPARVSGGQDVVVHARFEMCAGEPQAHFFSQRIAVLKPVRDGYCRLGGEELSVDAPASDACGGPQRFPRLLRWLPLTSARRDTLALEDRFDDCPGSTHAVRETLTFVDARGNELVKLFEIQTHEASWDEPEEPARSVGRAVEPVGRFPKKLQVIEEVSCPEGNPTPSCKPGKSTSTWVLRGGRYVPQ